MMKANQIKQLLFALSGMLVASCNLAWSNELAHGALASMDDPVLKKYLEKIRGAEQGELNSIKSNALGSVFKNVDFYSLRFRHYPVAIEPPKPLGLNNVFAVSDGKVTLLKSDKELKKYFEQSVEVAPLASDKKQVVESWLTLLKELQRDGFFEFQKPAVQMNDQKVTGEIEVVEQRRDKGKLTVACEFEESGKLRSISFKSSLYRGIRPR